MSHHAAPEDHEPNKPSADADELTIDPVLKKLVDAMLCLGFDPDDICCNRPIERLTDEVLANAMIQAMETRPDAIDARELLAQARDNAQLVRENLKETFEALSSKHGAFISSESNAARIIEDVLQAEDLPRHRITAMRQRILKELLLTLPSGAESRGKSISISDCMEHDAEELRKLRNNLDKSVADGTAEKIYARLVIARTTPRQNGQYFRNLSLLLGADGEENIEDSTHRIQLAAQEYVYGLKKDPRLAYRTSWDNLEAYFHLHEMPEPKQKGHLAVQALAAGASCKEFDFLLAEKDAEIAVLRDKLSKAEEMKTSLIAENITLKRLGRAASREKEKNTFYHGGSVQRAPENKERKPVEKEKHTEFDEDLMKPFPATLPLDATCRPPQARWLTRIDEKRTSGVNSSLPPK